MKSKRRVVAWLALVIATLVIASCPNPISSSNSKGGSLSIQLTNHINSKTLVPSIDMNAANFAVSGIGPGGATFSQTTSGGSVTVSALAFGSWSVTVNALNAEGTIIGSGQATAAVNTGQTTTVNITVVPLSGNGTLSLTVTWTASRVQTPSIQASLTPPSGSAITLSFSVSGNQATYSSTTIPAGYQTLTLQLLDNNIPVMGAVDVARIVAGQTTTGSYAFTNVNQPGGTVVVNITPALANPIPVSISGVNATITPGTSITATASVSDGTANVISVWYLNGVSQATGSSYTFGSTLAAGFYRLDVTAFTADGTRGGSATASFQVNGASGPFVYVINQNSSNLSGFAMGSGGLLTPLSTPTFAEGGFPQAIAVAPSGSFIYVADNDSNVNVYAIGAGGLLTQVSSITTVTGSTLRGVVVTPKGSFLYATNDETNNVSAYAIGSGGLLTPLSTPTFAAGSWPMGIAVTPNGSFLYVANYNSSTISAYAVGTNGLLTPLGTFSSGLSGPWQITVTPNGSFLYVTNLGNFTIAAFAIGSGGVLTPLGAFATASYPYGIAVTANGSYLYVTNGGSQGSNCISAYAISSGGLLTPLSTPTFAAGNNPMGIAVAPNGSFLYVTNFGDSNVTAYANTVSAYTIGSGGLLTPLNPFTFATGTGPVAIAVVP